MSLSDREAKGLMRKDSRMVPLWAAAVMSLVGFSLGVYCRVLWDLAMLIIWRGGP
jgi:hypothetical protein